jgi:hypothetical protein
MHPESIAAIGTKQTLRKKMERLIRRHGGSGATPPVLADCVHSQSSEDDPDTWWVLLAIAVGPPGDEQAFWVAERYRKHGGRWLFLDSPRSVPVLEPFEPFFERYGTDDEWQSWQLRGERSHGLYEYGWLAVPPRPTAPLAFAATAPASSDHDAPVQPIWLADDWPVAEGAVAAGQPYEQQEGGWVFLETARDPKTDMTSAQLAAATERMLWETDWAAEGLNYDAWYFQRGRFMH